ncbi:hypothetical protein DFH29DRAFT_479411 [Suillus ampliporus]|nr:hypothetical protein DFH29DRAFT_479411 [Suillus ampliporus]
MSRWLLCANAFFPVVAVTATLVSGESLSYWILNAAHTTSSGSREVIIYYKTIDLCFRVWLYLWSQLPNDPALFDLVGVVQYGD